MVKKKSKEVVNKDEVILKDTTEINKFKSNKKVKSNNVKNMKKNILKMNIHKEKKMDAKENNVKESSDTEDLAQDDVQIKNSEAKERLTSMSKNTSDFRILFQDLHQTEKFSTISAKIVDLVNSKLSTQKDGSEVKVVQFIVKRLLLGACSSKADFRIACCTVLRTLLNRHPQFITLVIEHSETCFSDNEMDSCSDYTIGHIMVIGAILLSSSLEKANLESSVVKCLVKKLLKLTRKKFSYGPIAGQILVNYMCKDMCEDSLRLVWNLTQKDVSGDVSELKPCSMWLRFVFCRRDVAEKLGIDKRPLKDLRDPLLTPSFYTYFEKTIRTLALSEMLVDALVDDFLKLLFAVEIEDSSVACLEEFFKSAVRPLVYDLSPFGAQCVLNIVQMALLHASSKSDVEAVLSEEIMELLFWGHSQKELGQSLQRVHAAVIRLVFKLQKTNSDVQSVVMKQLLRSETASFEYLTYVTKLIHSVVDYLSSGAVRQYAEMLTTLIENTEKKKYLHAVWAVQSLSFLVNLPVVGGADDLEWRGKRVVEVVRFAFFRKHKKEKAKQLKECFLRSFNLLKKNQEKQIQMLRYVVKEVKVLLKSSPEECSLSEEETKRCLTCMKRVKRLSKAQGDQSYCKAFELLYYHMILYTFVNSEDSKELMDNVEGAFETVFGQSEASRKAKNAREKEQVEAILDLLIFILLKDERLWRKLVAGIFRSLCLVIPPSSYHIITDLIHPPPDEGGEETDEGSEAETEGESETDEGSESEGDDDIEEGGLEDDRLIRLKIEMQKLVGVPSDIDIDIDSVPEEELKAMDSHFGPLMGQYVSLQQRQRKGKRFRAKEEAAQTHVKTRLFDLLDIVVDEAPSLGFLLHLQLPLMGALVEAAADQKESPVLSRLRSLFVSLGKVRKLASSDSTTLEHLEEQLQLLFTSKFKAVKKIAKEFDICCSFVIRAGLDLPGSAKGRIEPRLLFVTYADYVENNFKREVNLPHGPLQLESEHLSVVVERLARLSSVRSLPPSRRKAGLEMVRSVFLNKKAIEQMGHDVLKGALKAISEGLIEAYDAVEDEKHVQCSFLIGANELLVTLSKLKGKCEWVSWFDWTGVGSSVSSFADRVPLQRFKALKRSLMVLSNRMNLNLNLNNKSVKTDKEGNAKVAPVNKDSEQKRKKKKRKQKDVNDPAESSFQTDEEFRNESTPDTKQKSKKLKKSTSTKKKKEKAKSPFKERGEELHVSFSALSTLDGAEEEF